MVSIDRNGRWHDDKGRFASKAQIPPSLRADVIGEYKEDYRGRVHRPNGNFATQEEAKTYKNTLEELVTILRKPKGGRGGFLRDLPEGFSEDMRKNGYFMKRQLALYYTCRCKIKKDSPKFTVIEKPNKENDDMFIVEHNLAISTSDYNFSLQQAKDIHNERWKDHKLISIKPDIIKVFAGLRK